MPSAQAGDGNASICVRQFARRRAAGFAQAPERRGSSLLTRNKAWGSGEGLPALDGPTVSHVVGRCARQGGSCQEPACGCLTHFLHDLSHDVVTPH